MMAMSRKSPGGVLSALLLIVLLIFALSCSRPPSRADVARAYQGAVDASDIDSLLSLFADDAIVEFVGFTSAMHGKEALRGKAEYDSALNVRLALTVMETRKDTVFCSAVETNGWAQEAGLPSYVYPSYFIVIRAGKITHLRADLDPATIARLNELMGILLPWAEQNRPEALAELTSAGEFTFNARSAEIMMRLLRDWRGSMGAR